MIALKLTKLFFSILQNSFKPEKVLPMNVLHGELGRYPIETFY